MLILGKFKLCWHVPRLDIWTDAMSHLGGVLHNLGSNLVPLSIMLHICTFAQHYGPGHQTNPESTSASVSCWLMYFLVISVNWELISFTLTDSVSEEPFHNKALVSEDTVKIESCHQHVTEKACITTNHLTTPVSLTWVRPLTWQVKLYIASEKVKLYIISKYVITVSHINII